MLYHEHIFLSLVLCCCLCVSASAATWPQISIITSVYKGDKFISGFLEDITRQTIFDQCELIIINAASPGNEEPIILEYAERYPNIVYVKLEEDPGIYAVWNYGIKMARAEFVGNANVDDRLHPQCYEVFLKTLREHPAVDLVYSDFYFTSEANVPVEACRSKRATHYPEFSPKALLSICLPNNHPVWRKSMHDKCGLFDESFKHVGDLEMWMRAAVSGAIFLKIPGIYGLFYVNPKGLSTNKEYNKKIHLEHQRMNAVRQVIRRMP